MVLLRGDGVVNYSKNYTVWRLTKIVDTQKDQMALLALYRKINFQILCLRFWIIAKRFDVEWVVN